MQSELPTKLKALVADDDAAIRRLLVSALGREGFETDEAEDGEAAARLLSRSKYHLVLTDLAMPQRHGHALVVDLLSQPDRPLVVVLTGLLEPKLAKDLMARGVDDIVFKPVQFLTLAAKLRSLVDRKQSISHAPDANRSRLVPASRTERQRVRVTAEEVEARLLELMSMPPLSRTGVEVYHLTISPESSVRQVAAAVEREPSLVTDVLRFANSAFFNPTGKQITDVETAVVRLGQKRVGELAIATATAATVSQESVPFLPLPPIWRKCLAAGICMEMLLDQTQTREREDGLFVSAVLQPMCRVILASMFPRQYEELLKQAAFESRPIVELEQEVFPESAGAIAARALAAWGIPEKIHYPLRYAGQPFHALSGLPKGLRHSVEFLKAAVCVGELAAQNFHEGDLVDFPSASLLDRLGVKSLTSMIDQCRCDLEAIANWNVEQEPKSKRAANVPVPPKQPYVAYKRINSAPIDFIPYFLAGDVRLLGVADNVATEGGQLIVNCLDTPVAQLIGQLRAPNNGSVVIVASPEQAERLQSFGKVVTLPCSHKALMNACVPATLSC